MGWGVQFEMDAGKPAAESGGKPSALVRFATVPTFASVVVRRKKWAVRRNKLSPHLKLTKAVLEIRFRRMTLF